MKVFGFICASIIALALLMSLTVGFEWLGIKKKAWLEPQRKAVETDVYRNSKSFVDGTIRELRQLQTEYLTSSSEHKSAIRARVLHIADELDPQWLNTRPDLANFVQSLRNPTVTTGFPQ